MQNFTYHVPTKILFGKDEERNSGRELAGIGATRVLIHFGSDRVRSSGLLGRVEASLKQAGIYTVNLGGVEPNPRLALVREGIELCRREKIDAILCVGGGSVIDSAKGIAAGAGYGGDVWDFYTDKAAPEEALPIGVVLTIPAAGSEASPGSVVTRVDSRQKFYFNAQCVRPSFAILNPELTFSLPPYQTAAGAADIMAHIMERYFTREPNVDLTDRLCEAALRTIIRNVPKVLADPEDYAARAEIMWTGTIAHNDLLGTGRIGDWASHDIEHELSAQYDVTHGAGLAVIFPAWMRYVNGEDPDRFVQFATRVWSVEYKADDRQAMIDAGIQKLKDFFALIGLPTTLRELGIEDNRYSEMADQALRHGSLGNFRKLHKEDVVEIYRLAEG